MKSHLTLGAILLLALPALGQDAEPAETQPTRDARALEILKQADNATKSVSAVQYHASLKPSGVAEARFAPAEGDALMPTGPLANDVRRRLIHNPRPRTAR